jgi:hypothetical protein
MMNPSTHGVFDSDALDDYHCEIHSMVVGTQQRPLSTSIHQVNTWERCWDSRRQVRCIGVVGATEFTCQNGKILKVWELGDLKSLKVSCSRHCSEMKSTAVVLC